MDQPFWAEIAAVVGLLLFGGFIVVVWAVRRAESRIATALQTSSSIISNALAAADSYRALDGMAEAIGDLFGADACLVALPTGDGRLFCGPAHGFPDPDDLLIDEHEGIAGASYTTGKVIIVTDASKEPRFIHALPNIRFAISVPLRYEGKMVGSFELESARRKYTERDLRILMPLADQIAAAIEHLKLRVDAEERAEREAKAVRELQAVSGIVMAGVASSSDLEGALQSMIKEISARLGWESLAVVLWAEDGMLYTRAFYGYPNHSTLIRFSPGEGIVGSVATSGVGRLAKNVHEDPDYLDLVSETATEMCVPMFAGGRCLGVLNTESPRPGAFDDEDFKLLGMLARQMALVTSERG